MPDTRQLSEVVHEWAVVFMHRSVGDFKRFMDSSGLSFSQIHILMRLFHGGCAGVSEIGETMGFTSAAASQSVDRLVQMGLVERTENRVDRRAKNLELTPRGRALVEQGITARCSWVEAVTRNLTPDQQTMIASALSLLTAAAGRIEE